MRTQMSGSSWAILLNGSTINSGTDTTHTGASGERYVGIQGFPGNAPDGKLVIVDNFRAADYIGNQFQPTGVAAVLAGVLAIPSVGFRVTPATP
jgi:hypothetical protein